LNAGRASGCRSCGGPRLEVFLTLGELPLSDGFVSSREAAVAAERFPLDVAFCADCSLVQILHTVSPGELFGDDYPYFSSVTATLLEHTRASVEARIDEFGLDASSFVVELASNDGYLLQYYRDAGVPHLGIDPAKGPVEAARALGIETRHAFFGRELARSLRAEGKRADVIHANNVLAHVADTNGFVAGIAQLLKPSGTAVIEVPYVRDLIDQAQFDTIYHEHLCYFSVTALVALLARHGLHLNRVERVAIHGGSLRLFAASRRAPEDSVEALLAEERAVGLDGIDYFKGFAARVEVIRSELRDLLLDLKAQGRRIAGYGAAAKGTIMLNFVGIDDRMLEWVADKNVHKQDRFVPGVALEIVAPARITGDRPDCLLVLPWNITAEIVRQQQGFAARGGRFIVPVPKPRLLEPEGSLPEPAI
jgi:SAM-dependent methyltransferase